MLLQSSWGWAQMFTLGVLTGSFTGERNHVVLVVQCRCVRQGVRVPETGRESEAH